MGDLIFLFMLNFPVAYRSAKNLKKMNDKLKLIANPDKIIRDYAMFEKLPTTNPSISKIDSSSGRIKNEHFMMMADHLTMELNSTTFELRAAFAEGDVIVQMLAPEGAEEYVAFAHSAIYRPEASRLDLTGWIESHYGDSIFLPAGRKNELVLPTDGSFYQDPEQGLSSVHEAEVEAEDAAYP